MTYSEIRSVEELTAMFSPPRPSTAAKVRTTIHPIDREFIAASPLCFLATCDAQGQCDVSPKGDPPGFVHVIDQTHLAIPDRPGNRRLDGWRNILSCPQVGTLFVVPGRTDTLRINGKARLLSDAPFFDAMTVKGHRPKLALLVQVQEVFFHCGKSFMRSETWNPPSWGKHDLPSRAQIYQTLEDPSESLESINEYYGPSYAKRLYKDAE